MMNMKKSQVKYAFLRLIVAVIIGSLYGYLSNNFMYGVRIGFIIGIVFAILDSLHKSN
jgi:hypothetical protein